MRPTGTHKQLAARRKRTLALLRKGQRTVAVAAVVGVTERTVRRWQQTTRTPQRRVQRPPGRPAHLSAQPLERLKRQLPRGAYAYG